MAASGERAPKAVANSLECPGYRKAVPSASKADSGEQGGCTSISRQESEVYQGIGNRSGSAGAGKRGYTAFLDWCKTALQRLAYEVGSLPA